MRKLILGTAILSAIGVFGQSGIEITAYGDPTNIAGTTFTINATSTDLIGGEYVEQKFYVKNVSGEEKQLRITRKTLSVSNAWNDNICWPPLCWIVDNDVNSNVELYTTPNNMSYPAPILADQDEEEMKPQFYPPSGSASTAQYRYYVNHGGVYLDSVDVIIDFTLSTKQLESKVNFNVAPNPATEYVNIQVSGMDKATVRVVDLLGNVVYSDKISGTKKLDVSNFKNGVYFILVENEGIKTSSKKLVVRH